MDRPDTLNRRGVVVLFVLTLVGAVSQAEAVFSGDVGTGSFVLFVAFSIASVVLLWQLFERNRPAEK
ncbi:hypothetical protein [Haloferax profundi]|uniref:Uncharacterized protein n=1 Tax=Haloferax profundi TaxID=1544718 RepID=A0A0W1SJF8_9EURY|nr:hypothetical protein [Haloferax profundi]KTG26381.1 hypothetical protein AUR66_00710 [Haloferax profundi]